MRRDVYLSASCFEAKRDVVTLIALTAPTESAKGTLREKADLVTTAMYSHVGQLDDLSPFDYLDISGNICEV